MHLETGELLTLLYHVSYVTLLCVVRTVQIIRTLCTDFQYIFPTGRLLLEPNCLLETVLLYVCNHPLLSLHIDPLPLVPKDVSTEVLKADGRRDNPTHWI